MYLLTTAMLLLLVGCGSTPTPNSDLPGWTQTPVRTTDAGYLIYLGRSTSDSPDRASQDAELAAWHDLANECSFVPRTARIEERYTRPVRLIFESFVKVAVLFAECEGAQRTNSPEAIRSLANLTVTEQLKRYRERYHPTPANDSDAGIEISPAFSSQVRSDQRMRVILSPAASPTIRFVPRAATRTAPYRVRGPHRGPASFRGKRR